MEDPTDDVRRRSFLKWASAVGLSAVAPGTVAAVAQENGDGQPDDLPVEPSDVDRDGDVTITHPSEYSSVRDRVTRATQADDPSEKYDSRLRRELEEGDRTEVDLYVRTVGTPVNVQTERYGRQIDGWTPKQGEVQRLSQFGEVGYVPEFLSTKISLFDVHVDDVSEIGGLPFVLTVGLKPTVEDPLERSSVTDPSTESHGDQARNYVDSNKIRSDEMCGFDQVADEDNLSSSTAKIGVVDTGYGSSPGSWDQNYAEPYIDETLANDFNSNWNTDTDGHGTLTANTVAYMLQDGWSDMIVPMKIDSYGDWADGARAAIEDATAWDIEVLNISMGFTGHYSAQCQSELCDELKGYADAGHISVGSSGNDAEEVTEPGASKWDIAVGGVHDDECSDGFMLDPSSTLSDPAEYRDETACAPCNTGLMEEFVPDVHGVMAIYGGNMDSYVYGTSVAAPQFAAAALLLKHNGADQLPDTFGEIKDMARAQSVTNVCPDAESDQGQLMHANDLLSELPPSLPENVSFEWISDTAARLTWDPSHSAGVPDMQDYVTLYSYCDGKCSARTWDVDAPQTTMVLDTLDPDTAYDMDGLFAVDTDGNTSEKVPLSFSTLATADLIATIDPEATDLSVGDTARFDAVDNTDDSHWVDSLQWDFDDDGATASSWYAEHTYDEAGTYWVTLEATDNGGDTTTAAVEITVS